MCCFKESLLWFSNQALFLVPVRGSCKGSYQGLGPGLQGLFRVGLLLGIRLLIRFFGFYGFRVYTN